MMDISGNQLKTLTLEGAKPAKVVVETEEVRVDKTVAPDESVDVIQESKNEIQNQAENLHVAVSQINDYVQNLQRNLQFSVDEVTGKDVVTIIDSETEQVIRQIPSEEILEVARHLTVNSEEGVQLFSTKV
jgi:flagellar protein FlaG